MAQSTTSTASPTPTTQRTAETDAAADAMARATLLSDGGGDPPAPAATTAAAPAPAPATTPRERLPSLTLEPLCIAYYCTGHGLGHATRAIEVCKHLVARGHSVTVVTGAPARVFLQQVPAARFTLRRAVLDCGSKQLDPFTVDTRGSLEEYYATAVAHRDELLQAEASWLRTTRTDLVVSDVVPIACAAAARAGIPAVAVTNFSWDFVYSEYLTTTRRPEFRALVWQIARDYSSAALLLRLPGHVPMPAFQVRGLCVVCSVCACVGVCGCATPLPFTAIRSTHKQQRLDPALEKKKTKKKKGGRGRALGRPPRPEAPRPDPPRARPPPRRPHGRPHLRRPPRRAGAP